MSTLRAKMIEQMCLRRLAPKTQQAYIGAVKQLAAFYHRSPDQITPKEVESYLHYLLVKKKVAWSTCNIAINAFRFLYLKTLGWDALRLKLPPCKREQKLPNILSTQEVERILNAPRNLKHRVLLMTTYAAGLRVGEVVRLKTTDIDSARMSIRVRQGKGRKDRDTLLSPRLLTELRTYWKIRRPQPWLFPGADTSRHLSISSAQHMYYKAKQDARISRGSGIHTLRHCFAAHALEAGVDSRTLQLLLGHRSLNTTMRYLQVSQKHVLGVRSPLDLLVLPEST